MGPHGIRMIVVGVVLIAAHVSYLIIRPHEKKIPLAFMLPPVFLMLARTEPSSLRLGVWSGLIGAVLLPLAAGIGRLRYGPTRGYALGLGITVAECLLLSAMCGWTLSHPSS